MLNQLLLSSVIYTTPLLLAAIGGYYSERSGVVNIALEGKMLIGAFFAVAGTWWTGNFFLGLTIAATSGAVIGLLHGVVSVYLKCNHIVSGIGINILTLGLTGVLIEVVFGRSGSTPSVGSLPSLLNGIPLLFLIGIIILFFTYFWSTKTVAGLRHRAAGESIDASTKAGMNVKNIRLRGSVIAGVLCAISGSQQSLGELGSFVERMTAGRGFIALAALILARWKVLPIIFTTFLFGFTEALAENLEEIFPSLPSDIILLLPFLITLTILTGFAGEIRSPKDLGKLI